MVFNIGGPLLHETAECLFLTVPQRRKGLAPERGPLNSRLEGEITVDPEQLTIRSGATESMNVIHHRFHFEGRRFEICKTVVKDETEFNKLLQLLAER